MRSLTFLRKWTPSSKCVVHHVPLHQSDWPLMNHLYYNHQLSSLHANSCYHTSRTWQRLEHRLRQHHEDLQIQKCARRIMSLLETSSAGVDSASSTAVLNQNTSTVAQILRHLSPYARLELERTIAKMAAHRSHAPQQHHATPSTISTTATTTSVATTATITGTSPSTAPAAAATSAPTVSNAAAASTITIQEPPFSELRLLMYQQAIPFVGFGIMDNALLILAGDMIDQSLGVSLGISTMCAAAIGNIVSDVAGVMLGTVVEDFCARLGLPTPHLSEAQRTLRSVRLANQTGICVGLVVGCIIGMFPLLWIDTSKTVRLKRQAKLQELVQDVMEEAKSLVQAERTTLFLRVASEDTHLTPTGDGQYLYAKYHTNGHPHHHKERSNASVEVGGDGTDNALPSSSSVPRGNSREMAKAAAADDFVGGLPSTTTSRLIPLGRGIVSRSALTGQALNLYHVQAEPDFDPDTFDLHHVTVKNMLCVPVLDEQGRAIAVIQAINKQKPTERQTTQSRPSATASTPTEEREVGKRAIPKENMLQGFTSNDVQILKALASHISISLQSLSKDDADVTMRHTIRTLKEHGTGILEQNQNQIRCRPLFPADESGLK